MDDAARWMAHMRRGDFAAAWAISDALLAERAGTSCWHLPRHEQFLWDGTPLTGRRVVIHCYHGLGDTLQFIRYVPLLDAADVTVIVQPSLIPLLETMRGGARLVPLSDAGVPRAAGEVHVEVMELAYIFRTTLDTIPAAVPYLFVDAADRGGEEVRDAAGHATRVGIVWEGGDWDPRRNVPRALLESLGDVDGVSIVPLQRGSSDAVDTPLALARSMLAVDLVVTVDSFPAHLAGALARPVWTLLHADCDWRWMNDRDDSPWYPTMRLFRQERAGEFAPVVARVAAALRARQSP